MTEVLELESESSLCLLIASSWEIVASEVRGFLIDK